MTGLFASLGIAAALGVPDACPAQGPDVASQGPPRAVLTDTLQATAAGTPEEIRLLLPPGSIWPQDLREQVEAEILKGWDSGAVYGPLERGKGLWLRSDIVTHQDESGVVNVPAVMDGQLSLRGRVETTRLDLARRVVLLIDASQSANAKTIFRYPDGREEEIPVIEAERRALEDLLGRVDPNQVELGAIAYGHKTRVLAEPGASLDEMRAAIDGFRRQQARGKGRTDAICALWTASEWLEETPPGVESTIVMLTDGDIPDSGRFVRCDRTSNELSLAACQARRNTRACPAARPLLPQDGDDRQQLALFASEVAGQVRVSPIVMDPEPAEDIYRSLAEITAGQYVEISSAEAIQYAIPPLVLNEVKAVRARNLRTKRETGNLYDPLTGLLSGEIELLPGANDIEITMQSDDGDEAVYRLRAFAAERTLKTYLEELRARNVSLALKRDKLREEARQLIGGLRRSVVIQPD